MALQRDSFAYISITSSWSVIDTMMKGKMPFITAEVIYLIGAVCRTRDSLRRSLTIEKSSPT